MKTLTIRLPFTLLLFLILITSNGIAQETKTISGRVTATDGKPVAGASVSVKGRSQGTATDAEGNFTLPGVGKNDVLEISNVGYATQSVSVGANSSLQISLTPEIKPEEEVVVIAYGTQIKRKITGAVQTVNANELDEIPVAQITQKLQGKMAGVQIIQGHGRPGLGMSVRIRGQASINAQGQPLYVVDGFPISGDIANINPDEIESFTVLKDASAASLYGSRAAFGVVLIETKRGKAGQNNLTLNTYYGVQQVPQKGRPDMMNAREFAQFEKEVYEFNGRPVPAAYQNPDQYGEGTDWYDVLLRSAPIHDISISLNSSKDKFSTAVTAGYFNQQGVVLNSNYRRFALRLNSEYRFNDKLSFQFNAAPNYSINDGPTTDAGPLFSGLNGGGVINAALATSPLAVHINPDGSLPTNAEGPGLFPNPNWYRTLQETEAKTKRFRLLSNAAIRYEIIKGLAVRSTINIELDQSQFNFFSPSTSGIVGAAPPQKAVGSASNTNFYSWLSENTATYVRGFGDHNVDALIGFSSQRTRSDGSFINKTDFPDDRVHTLGAAATTTSSSTDIQEWSLLSYIARLNYSFKNRYILSGTFRRDGSSRFGTNNKWGNFPSISAGWVISDESFMRNISMISFLKLRASYGLTGNNNIGNYSYYANMNSANYVLHNVFAPGRSVGSLANLDLGWERSRQTDIGLEIGLFKNRLTVNYDYYVKNTDGLLYNVAIPVQSGFGSVLTNLGEFKFWGHEITISSQNIVNRQLRWSTDFNIAFNDNKVVKLGATDAPIFGTGATTITRVGDRIGQFWGFDFLGVYMNQHDFDNAPHYPTSAVGTVKMRDVNGDGQITNSNDDKTIIGNPWPTFTFGITNNFSWKNFDLSIVGAGSYGNDIMQRALELLQNLDGVFNVTRDVARRWKSEQDPGDGLHPSVKSGTTDLARLSNSRWVSDGSFFTIKNIALGYRVPLKSSTFRNVRVYGSIQQAFVFTKYDGANPEVSLQGSDALNQGIDYSAYPVPRTFTVGVQVGL